MAVDLPVHELFVEQAKTEASQSYFDYNDVTTIVVNEEAINNAIQNILLTTIGSLPGKPEFGSNTNNILFAMISGTSTSDILENSILSALIKWEPRITVTKINIKTIPEYNRMIADISYSYNILGGNVDANTSILLKD